MSGAGGGGRADQPGGGEIIFEVRDPSHRPAPADRGAEEEDE
jgi:hypothetical protein